MYIQYDIFSFYSSPIFILIITFLFQIIFSNSKKAVSLTDYRFLSIFI